MRPTRDSWAMDMALLTSRQATCLRRAVGCVLLSARGHVLATGYNGVAAGQPHCNEQTSLRITMGAEPIKWVDGPLGSRFPHYQAEDTQPVYAHACPGARAPSGTNLDGCGAIHAEQNALLQCRDVYQIHTAYTTTSPCMTCAKLLLNTSCERIVFQEEYIHSADQKALWIKAGRDWCFRPNKI